MSMSLPKTCAAPPNSLSEAQQDALRRDGYLLIPDAVGADTMASLIANLAALSESGGRRERAGQVYGVRNLLQASPAVRAVAASPAIRAAVEPILGASACPVRGLLFDKPAAANWKVPWHQDLSIAVRECVDLPGFGPWSVKAGVLHVQPPAEVLEGMLAVRLHLDDCGADNGPLQVIPGSHAAGKLDAAAIRAWRERRPAEACLARRGDLLLMRPLLLHASGAATAVAHRRVVHLEFAAGPLPGGLEWLEA